MPEARRRETENCFEIVARTLCRFPLQRPVTDQNPLAHVRQRRATSTWAALTCFDEWPPERLIHGVEQHPCLAVRHPHGPCGGGNGPEPVDAFQQVSLPGTEDSVATELDANDQLRRSGCLCRRLPQRVLPFRDGYSTTQGACVAARVGVDEQR